MNTPQIPDNPIRHDPDFGMVRIIDNGGELMPDGSIARPPMYPETRDMPRERD